MTTKLEYTQLIERYLDGEMTIEERIWFEQELKVDEQLALEFRLEIQIHEALSQEDIIDFLGKLQKASSQIKGERKPHVVPLYRRTARVAAIITLLISLSGILYLTLPRDYSSEKLFEHYYSYQRNEGVTRSGNTNLVEAVLRFQSGDFNGAVSMFDVILTEDSSNIAVQFYNGIAHIELQNYDEAIASFEYIIGHNQNLYVDHAEWYLGLCYLRMNEEEKAVAQFQSIAENNGNYHAGEAMDLLKKLKVSEL